MNSKRKYITIILLIGLVISGCAGQAGPTITQVIAFGDSLSDNGAAQQITKKDVEDNVSGAFILPPAEVYWEGRCSNGPVAVDVLAERLNVKLEDYAVGGAMSNEENAIKIGNLTMTGLLSQVEKYKSTLAGTQADPDALYFIMISGNDWDGLSKELYGTYKAEVADETLKNIETSVAELTKLGAKRFFVVSSFDGSKQPDTVMNGLASFAKAFQERFNTQLPTRMAELSKQLGIEITVFDLQAVEDKIRSDPGKVGLTNLTEPCLSDMFDTTACDNPDERYFWDPYHPTRKVHQIIGEAMAAEYGK
jgi:phospholipase/lecithinase/hemolysin